MLITLLFIRHMCDDTGVLLTEAHSASNAVLLEGLRLEANSHSLETLARAMLHSRLSMLSQRDTS